MSLGGPETDSQVLAKAGQEGAVPWGWPGAEGWGGGCLGADPEGLWDGNSWGKVGRKRRRTQLSSPIWWGSFRPCFPRRGQSLTPGERGDFTTPREVTPALLELGPVEAPRAVWSGASVSGGPTRWSAHLYLAKVQQGADARQAPELAQQGHKDTQEVQPAAHGQQQHEEAAHAHQHRLDLALQAGVLPLLLWGGQGTCHHLPAIPEVRPGTGPGLPAAPDLPQCEPSPPLAAPCLPPPSPPLSEHLAGTRPFFLTRPRCLSPSLPAAALCLQSGEGGGTPAPSCRRRPASTATSNRSGSPGHSFC